MRRHVCRLAFLLSLAVVAPLEACFQKLDATASSQPAPSATDALVTEIDPSSIPVALSGADAAASNDPCDKTRQEKTQILTAFCARCHSGPAAVGLPPWNFVLDDRQLVAETWARAGQPPERFVIPGDPDHSALYQRMGVAKDMPPQPTDLSTPQNPKPSMADVTVIREWILNCLGAKEVVDAGAGSDTGTGGEAGTGGVAGTGGIGGGMGGMGAAGGTNGKGGTGGTRTATGGASGVGGAGGSAGAQGTGGTTPACASDVTAGGSCASGTAECALTHHVCRCELSNGRHRWVCY